MAEGQALLSRVENPRSPRRTFQRLDHMFMIDDIRTINTILVRWHSSVPFVELRSESIFLLYFLLACLHSHVVYITRTTSRYLIQFLSLNLLGSNDPNTIPDPTRIRCSRFRIVLYVSARTPFCLDLATIYVSSGLRTFRLCSLVTS